MGAVRSHTIKIFCGSIISLDRVKLGTLNLVCKLIVVSTRVRVINYPQMGCVQDHVTSSNFEKYVIISWKQYETETY